MSRQPIQNIDPTCIECGRLAELTNGRPIYPDRPDLWDRPYYRCECGAYVGCHPGTEIPLGYPAGPETRRARSRAHEAFDPLWRRKMNRDKVSKSKARAAGYAWLAEQLGIEVSACHISHFDTPTCQKVVRLCMGVGRR